MPDAHPPLPGPFVQPNLLAIEEALRDVTFPIGKRELMDELDDERTVIMEGRNVELRTLVRDLRDDYFESEEEFRALLEDAYGMAGDGAETIVSPAPPTGFPESMPLSAPGASDQPALPEDNA